MLGSRTIAVILAQARLCASHANADPQSFISRRIWFQVQLEFKHKSKTAPKVAPVQRSKQQVLEVGPVSTALTESLASLSLIESGALTMMSPLSVCVRMFVLSDW